MRDSVPSPTRHSGALIPVLVAVLAAGACSRGARFDRYLAERVPFAAVHFETDLIFPGPESGRYLATNWTPDHPWSTSTVYAEETSATIRFFSVSEVPPTFVAKARPEGSGPTQTLALSLNGRPVGTETMGVDWATYQFPLPAAALRVGWNDLELRFATAFPQVSDDPDRLDPPPRAARFQRIELWPGLDRPYEPERPPAVALADLGDGAAGPTSSASPGAIPIELAPDLVADFSTVAVDMTADSLMELYLLPAPEARLVGEVAATSDDAGEMHVIVEVVDDGGATRIWEDILTGDGTWTVEADLEAWAETLVRLRLRVFGTENGTVRWTGLRTASDAEFPSVPDRPDLRFLIEPTRAAERYGAAVRPHELLAAPQSGGLGRPDVVVIVLDAARADRFEGELGAELAPNVQALAAEGTAFARAWAPSSWTGQSIPAMLVGRYPDAVGIEDWASRLAPDTTTLAELLAEAGYHTALWSQHTIYNRRQELRDGFEQFENAAPIADENRAALPELSTMFEEGRPTFAMIHLLPPHTPYMPPEPFAGSRSAWYTGDVPITAEILNTFDRRFASEQATLRDEIRRAAIAKYEENISFADYLVGRLVEELRRVGRYDDALIIVTSDHGEAFYEHGQFLHNHLLYEEFIRVPLVVKWPASVGAFVGSIDEPVSLVDLAPSLVDGLGISDQRARFQGRSFLPLVSGQGTAPRLLYAYTSGSARPEVPPRPQYALLWDDLKLLYEARTDRTALYRLSDDPEEQTDIAAVHETRVRWLHQMLRTAQAHNAALSLEAGGAVTEELDPETIRRLRALGYLR